MLMKHPKTVWLLSAGHGMHWQANPFHRTEGLQDASQSVERHTKRPLPKGAALGHGHQRNQALTVVPAVSPLYVYSGSLMSSQAMTAGSFLYRRPV